MSTRIFAGDDILAQFSNQIGALGAVEGHKALARAVNRVTATVEGRVIRALVKQTSIPRRIVKQQVSKRTVQPGSMHTLEGRVIARGNPVSLKVMGARQFSYGVKVKIRGETERLEGAFIKAGTFRSSKDVANGHVFRRVTTASLPIEKQFGPAIPTEMIQGATAQVFERTVAEMLPQRIRHELSRMLPR